VAADIVFEALAFVDGTTGMYNFFNFEFVGRASTVPDASGQSSFQVTLPQGLYRVDVIPRDGQSALWVYKVDVTGPSMQNFVLSASQVIVGSAALSDGRPLSLATIEAIPRSCTQTPGIADAGLTGLNPLDTPWCLPRAAQTTSGVDGKFRLALDPGGYTLRARPADGTHLPWTWKTFEVGPPAPPPKLVVPAPFHSSFKLVDPGDNPVLRAVVQAFYAPPAGGPAVELGEAFTGTDGSVDLYMALPQ
jgi:hypothetical protein